MIKKSILVVALVSGLFGCATESYNRVQPQVVESAYTQYHGKRTKIAVGKFGNRTDYMRGIFSDGVDRLGGQGKGILITHLQQSGRFTVLDRSNMEEIAKESGYSKVAQNIKGAEFIITGEIAEFGRKQVGDVQLYGILGSGKKQVAYSKVNLNVVNIKTSEVIFAVQGAGNYALSSREIVGFGGTSGYDSTLNGKVLDLAVREAVNRLVEGVEQGRLRVN